MLQDSSQAMSTISIPMLIAVCFIVTLILFFVGARKIGIVAFGLMIIITPLVWYGYLMLGTSSFQMAFADVLILALLSAIGGIIVGVGLQYKSGLKQAS